MIRAVPRSFGEGEALEEEAWRRMLKMSVISEPSRIFVMMDEHPDYINDGTFFMHPADRGHWHDVPSCSTPAPRVSLRGWACRDSSLEVSKARTKVVYSPILTSDYTPDERADYYWLIERAGIMK
jgi:hypothetical protein